MGEDSLANREVIIEFHTVGAYVKVTAMDVQTMTEISIQGSIHSSEEILKNAALKRLSYVMKKKSAD